VKKVIVINNLKKFLLEERNILSNKNVIIFTAASAEEILKIHREERGDLIIADLDMQGMTGDELITAIRKDDRLKHVSIIIKCNNNKCAIERCQSCGANAVVTEPVTRENLLCRVMDLLNVSERGSLRELVKVSVKGKFRDDFFFAVSRNASVSGILFETDKAFSQSDKITCSFVVQHTITADGEVVRVGRKTEDLYHYGVRFLNLDPESKVQIEEFVKSQKRTSDPGRN
jgi:CheY-like chemotaxis protein